MVKDILLALKEDLWNLYLAFVTRQYGLVMATLKSAPKKQQQFHSFISFTATVATTVAPSSFSARF
jgi:hypothetical protein